jgi:hypothetical protein
MFIGSETPWNASSSTTPLRSSRTRPDSIRLIFDPEAQTFSPTSCWVKHSSLRSCWSRTPASGVERWGRLRHSCSAGVRSVGRNQRCGVYPRDESCTPTTEFACRCACIRLHSQRWQPFGYPCLLGSPSTINVTAGSGRALYSPRRCRRCLAGLASGSDARMIRSAEKSLIRERIRCSTS